MPTYELRGVPVFFPYDAYEPQISYMETVISALQKGENALLESPTGTGKTLCLLCAVLAWRSVLAAREQLSISASIGYDNYLGNASIPKEREGATMLNEKLSSVAPIDSSKKLPLIVYASRTHSQLSQVISELRKTPYKPKIAIVSSREQLCANEGVRKLRSNGAMTAVCGQLVKKRNCHEYIQVDSAKKRLEVIRPRNDTASIMDIEDIMKLAKEHQACPYFLAKDDILEAELVFLPYNYLLDRKTQFTISSLDLNGAVVIFDEAHNIESSCGDATSTDITTYDLKACHREVGKVEKILKSGSFVQNITINMIQDSLKVIESLMAALHSLTFNADGQLLERGDYIEIFCEKAGINEGSVQRIVQYLEMIAKVYLEAEYTIKQQKLTSSLQVLVSAFKTIFKIKKDDSDNDNKENPKVPSNRQMSIERRNFRVFAHEERSPLNLGQEKMISYWCFNPGFAMKELSGNGLHSMILTSGTLSPLNSFSAELQVYSVSRVDQSNFF